MKKDDTVRNLESKFDRETCCASGIDKKEIPEILQRYSDSLLKPRIHGRYQWLL
jgi:hypothetical protein